MNGRRDTSSHPSSGEKISSIRKLNKAAMAKARGSDGSNLPFSIEIMVCRLTPSLSASTC